MTRIVWLTLCFTLWASAAAADPSTLIVSLLGGAAALGPVGVALVRIATGLVMSAIARRLRQRQMRQSDTGIRTQITTRGGTVPQTLILGTYATGGNIVAPFYAHGEADRIDNAYRTQIIDLADVPIDAVTAIWVDGRKFDLATHMTGPVHPDYGMSPDPVTRPVYAGHLWLKVFDGRQTAADPGLVARYGTHTQRPWTADHVGRGVAYAILTYRFDTEVFRAEPQVRFELRGARLYDWRRDSTAGGSGSQRWSNQATWVHTDNPIVQVYNVMRGIPLSDGAAWGLGVAAADLPLDWWTAAADRCDALVDGQPRYRAGFEARMATPDQGGDTPFDVVDRLLDACDAELADIGGTWIVWSAEPALPLATLTDDDLLIDHTDTFDPFPPLAERYNAVRGSYVSPEAGWEAKESPPRYDTAAAAEDGRVTVADLDLSAVWHGKQVQRLFKAWLKDARRFRRHVITLPPAYDRLKPFDTLTWTSGIHGYDAKLFRIERKEVDPLTLNVTLSLRERDPTDYDWSPADELPEAVGSTVIVEPGPLAVPGWNVEPVTITDAAGNARRPGIRISWTADLPGVRSVRWQVRVAETDAAVTSGSTDAVDLGEKVISEGLVPATAYEVRGRIAIRGRRTVWTGWTTVTTPAVHLGPEDLAPDLASVLADVHDWIDGGVTDLPAMLAANADAIAAEVAERVADAQALADRWRTQVDTARALAAEVAELAAADHAAREQIRQSLSATLGDMRATYDLAITALADDGLAAVTRIETLEATSDDLSSLIQTTQAAIVDGDEALALLIATMSVGSAIAFDHVAIWYFDDAVDGWTGSPVAPAAVSGWLRPGDGSTADSPTGLAVAGGSYAQVRARVRKVGSPVWTGHLWWAGVAQGWDAGRRITIAEPAWDAGIATITFNPAWSGVIDRIRLDLVSGADGSNYVEIDWVAIGRPAPGASSADITAERLARINADGALASDLLALSSRVDDAESGLTGQADAIEALDARVDVTESGLVAAAGRLDAVEADIADPSTGLGALAGAIDTLTSMVEATEGGAISAQAGALRALESIIRAVAAEGIEGAARAHQAAGNVREYVAKVAQDLNTRVDLTDGQVSIIAQAVTILQATIPGLATATALQALTTTVDTQGDDIDALSGSLTDLSVNVAGKASASALSSLTGRVTAAEGAISSQADAITSLSSGLSDTNATVATKASSSALSALSTTVSNQDDLISAITTALTRLGATVGPSTAETIWRMSAEATPAGALARIGLKAVASGTEGDTRVAALFLEAITGNKSRVIVQGDAFHVLIGTSTVPVFTVSGGVIRLASSLIRLDGDVVVDGSFQLSGDFIAPNAATRTVGPSDFTNPVIPYPGLSLTDSLAVTYGPVTFPAGSLRPLGASDGVGWLRGSMDIFLDGTVVCAGAASHSVFSFVVETRISGVWSAIASFEKVILAGQAAVTLTHVLKEADFNRAPASPELWTGIRVRSQMVSGAGRYSTGYYYATRPTVRQVNL